MIVATAGHVDHGKTTLVKALTGTDTDRLKEEKLRGMSIESGFAYASLGTGATIGFVDVPGHERFVHNMLAAMAAVDFALLVVAADDGPMPQTFEHLAILDLLGIRRGAVALSKIDRVAPPRLAQAQAEVKAALASTALRDAPVFPVAAGQGTGMDALRAHLAAVSGSLPRPALGGNFRLAVDRCFSVPGAGLVVTGAVFSGIARTGEQLLVSPKGIPVRIRGIRVHGEAADVASAGRRCALNLAGTDLKRDTVERGDWIVAPAAHAPSMRFDARVSVLPAQAKALKHWTPVHLHSGAAHLNARLALLEGAPIEPGGTARVQIVSEQPLALMRGDRFILRDQSAQQTIAGGSVLDPHAPARGRAKPARLAQLAALERPTPFEALQALLDAQPDGVPLDAFIRSWNMTADESATLTQALPVVRFMAEEGVYCVAPERWQALLERIRHGLRDWHTEQPEALGTTELLLSAGLGLRPSSPLWRALVRALCDQGAVIREGLGLRLADHRPRLSEEDARLLARVSDALRSAGLRPPVVGELAKMLKLEQEQPALLAFLERASHLGHLVRVAKNRFFLPVTVNELHWIAITLSEESASGVFDAATYRDRSGIGRNLTIELLEFMDRMHLTRYAGGTRKAIGHGLAAGAVDSATIAGERPQQDAAMR